MTEKDKLRVTVLKAGMDFDLWKIRLMGALQWHGLMDALNEDEASESSDAPARDAAKIAVDCARASALIVTALDETALRVVQKVNGNPSQMMTKLDERYNSTSTAAKYDRVTLMESYWEAGDACTD